VLAWPATPVKPGESFIKAFTIRVKDPLPTTPVGLSDKFSYDLRMDNIYGNNVRIQLEAPLAKQVEGASTQLPDTGAATSTIIILAVSALTLFFYFRNRQLMTEIKLLRGHHYQGGGGYL
jgi:LPXTG-motif cell wall-anchored protein